MKAWFFSAQNKQLRFGDGRLIELNTTHSYPPPIPPPPLPIDLSNYYPSEYASRGTRPDAESQQQLLKQYYTDYYSNYASTHPQYFDYGLVICLHGLHGSQYILDALHYAPSPILWQVELHEPVLSVTDKSVSKTRTYLGGGVDITPVLRQYMCTILLDTGKVWEIPDSVQTYIQTQDDTLRQTANDDATQFYSMDIWESYGAKAAAQATSKTIDGKSVRLCTIYIIAAIMLKDMNNKSSTPAGDATTPEGKRKFFQNSQQALSYFSDVSKYLNENIEANELASYGTSGWAATVTTPFDPTKFQNIDIKKYASFDSALGGPLGATPYSDWNTQWNAYNAVLEQNVLKFIYPS